MNPSDKNRISAGRTHEPIRQKEDAMFKEPRDELKFSWEDLGDIKGGRPNLGDMTTVAVYRLMQYTLRDVLIRRLGPDAAGEIMYEAGHRAGSEFCKNLLDTALDTDQFVAQLQQRMKEHRVGIFRVESLEPETLEMMLTVAEDLDCSGLPVSDEMVCNYDEGFLAGILETYTGKPMRAREVDCWASGERVCRFKVERGSAIFDLREKKD